MVYASLPTPVFGLRREFDRLFEDALGRTARTAWMPAANVRENANAFTFEFELPGVVPANVEVTANDGVLTVKGEKVAPAAVPQEGRQHVSERVYGAFSRSFEFPAAIDEAAIEASFASGILTVHVPTAAAAQPTKIEIKTK